MVPIFSILSAAGSALANGLSTARANKRNIQNFRENRMYNSPAAQMSRFRQAGLNPHLIYTQQNVSEAPPEMRSAQFDMASLASASSELETYQNVEKSRAEVDNLKKQNDLLDKQIAFQILQNKYYPSVTETNRRNVAMQTQKVFKDIQSIDYTIKHILPLEQKRFNLQSWSEQQKWILENKKFQNDVKRFGLSEQQFEEMKRQFNISHPLRSAIYDALSGYLQGMTPNQFSKQLGKDFSEIFTLTSKLLLNYFLQIFKGS